MIRTERGEPYFIFEDIALIPLRNCKGDIVNFALIDAEDIDRIMAVNKVWGLGRGCVCAPAKVDKKIIKMHRAILDVTDPKIIVDHRNHQTLDNRKSNLRKCTSQQNNMNKRCRKNTSSKYKGVSWHKKNKKWRAQIMINKKQKNLGCFKDEKEAARVYNEAAKELFGEFAYLNNIQEKTNE